MLRADTAADAEDPEGRIPVRAHQGAPASARGAGGGKDEEGGTEEGKVDEEETSW